ncbi:MAG TPA: hypothetical protein VLX29_09935 [Nitrospirota bacterium]|nr:hypothetical protein [Nitrospirota bacterium]
MAKVVPRLTKRPIGRILVDAGLVTEEKLSKALEEQQRTNRLVGEILVSMGEIDSKDLEIVLSLQRDLAVPEQAMTIAAGIRKKLGEILLTAKRITPDQLDWALGEQKRTGEKLGQVLVRLGMVTQRVIDTTVAIQTNQTGGPRVPTRLRLGELLVAAKYITREQLEDALRRQKGTNKKFGEVLVERGSFDPKIITWGLRLQEMLVKAALIAALSITSVTSVSVPEATAGSRSFMLQVRAAVLARANLKILQQPQELIVTDADVRRGFVQAQAASIIELKNNSPRGCLLSFVDNGLPFQETSVNVMGRDIVLGPDGGLVTLPVIGKATITLSYRFVLAEGTQPGTYEWPIALSASLL